MFATIANDGVRMQPRLVDGVAGEDGEFVDHARGARAPAW